MDLRLREADEFYAEIIPAELSSEGTSIMRQAFAGVLWTKQFYHYVIRDWLKGDPMCASWPRAMPPSM